MPRKKAPKEGDPAAEPEQRPEEKAAAKALRIAQERDRLVSGVLAGRLDTMHERVASILNRNQQARDSDITLMLEYWREFDGDVYRKVLERALA